MKLCFLKKKVLSLSLVFLLVLMMPLTTLTAEADE